MDLLASYSDDGDSAKNTPTSDRSEQMMPKLDTVKSDASLEAEWESFEKMICGAEAPTSVVPPMPVAYPILPSQVHHNTDSYSEPPVLTSIKDTDEVDIFESVDTHASKNVSQFNISSNQPPKLTDITLAPEFNTDGMYGEMPTLTKITSSSPEHSSSRSSSSSRSRSRSRSRSQSVDSDKSEPEQECKKKKATSPIELPAAFKKDLSPSRSSTSHRKDEKREKRSRSRSRSPHRKRRRSSDRKRSHSRSPGRRRSSDRKRRSRSRDKRSRRSSSRSRHRKQSHSRSKRRPSRERRSSRDRHRRRGSRDRRRERKNRHRRSRSRDRHRSASRSRSRSRERMRATGNPKEKHLTFKEKMRQQLLKASKSLTDKEGAGPSDLELPTETSSNTGVPLSAANIFSAISSSGNVTPQMALLQTMAAMHQKAQEITGVAVPKYYNPAAVNPLKYAEQVQKRKLLWSKNKEKKEDEGQWQSTAFVQDNDGKMAAKFRKLMGMKEDEEKPEDVDEEKARESEEKKKKTEEMFYRLDKEYEFARMTTHTQRGVGLGFHSQGFSNP